MSKQKSKKKAKTQKSQKNILRQEQFSITKETNYIIKKAQLNDSRVVKLGSLVLFSTQTGDAWILDTQDKLALCLARYGERQPFTITETNTNYSIGWNLEYQINGNSFIILDQLGQIKTIIGYPIDEILSASNATQ
ncbi:MAG: hypothetical protein KKD86_13185 [Bacteroidetes bacterium]|nr:hypothetical protein [Bacteroidota bacterium]MBU1679781.1 hypothetical protein [Bacteroidota bacterium]